MNAPPTCFLIDDDLDDQQIFLTALREVDDSISCATASDPVEAIDRLRQDPALAPDFIFVDINMPKINGLQCVTELKQLRHLGPTQVWMYSTSADDQIRERCRAAGAVGFLVKPAHVDDLILALRQILVPSILMQ